MVTSINEWRYEDVGRREQFKAQMLGKDSPKDRTIMYRNFEYQKEIRKKLMKYMVNKYGRDDLKIEPNDDIENYKTYDHWITVKSNGLAVQEWGLIRFEPHWGLIQFFGISDRNRKDVEDIKKFIDGVVKDYPIDIPADYLCMNFDRPFLFLDERELEVCDEADLMEFVTETTRRKVYNAFNLDDNEKRMFINYVHPSMMVSIIFVFYFAIYFEGRSQPFYSNLIFLIIIILAFFYLEVVAIQRIKNKPRDAVIEGIAFEKVVGREVIPESRRKLIMKYEEKYSDLIQEKVAEIKELKRKHWTRKT